MVVGRGYRKFDDADIELFCFDSLIGLLQNGVGRDVMGMLLTLTSNGSFLILGLILGPVPSDVLFEFRRV